MLVTLCFYLNGHNNNYVMAACLLLEQIAKCIYPIAVIILLDANVPIAFEDLVVSLFPVEVRGALQFVYSNLHSLDRKRRFEVLPFLSVHSSVCFFLDIHDEICDIDDMMKTIYQFVRTDQCIAVRFHSATNGNKGRIDAGQIGFNMRTVQRLRGGLQLDIHKELSLYDSHDDISYGCDERFLDWLLQQYFINTPNEEVFVMNKQWGQSLVDKYRTEQLCVLFTRKFGADALAQVML